MGRSIGKNKNIKKSRKKYLKRNGGLKEDRGVVLAAVNQNGEAMQYVAGVKQDGL
jgi:hypothetical protein